MASTPFSRLLRCVPIGDHARIVIGQPEDPIVDVGLALLKGGEVRVLVFSGSSILSPGVPTGEITTIKQLLSPLAMEEVGTIRCIGLNYKQHAQEVKMDIPSIPTVFLKPSTALASPWPEPVMIPTITQLDDSGDYEAEIAVIIGKTCKNVSEEDALDYVLGYTGSNDVSSRSSQFAQSQWCFSKGFDGSCPIGPVVVSTSIISQPQRLHLRGIHNGDVVQDCGADDLIFSIPKLVSFLSQGTTLPAGTVILTGTPAGVGVSCTPRRSVKAGDQFRVEILPHIGTLVNDFENE